jgi:hypothetical protein
MYQQHMESSGPGLIDKVPCTLALSPEENQVATFLTGTLVLESNGRQGV